MKLSSPWNADVNQVRKSLTQSPSGSRGFMKSISAYLLLCRPRPLWWRRLLDPLHCRWRCLWRPGPRCCRCRLLVGERGTVLAVGLGRTRLEEHRFGLLLDRRDLDGGWDRIGL